MSVLEKIANQVRDNLSTSKSRLPLSQLKSQINDMSDPLNFSDALKRNSRFLRFIAEIKKASPSKGLIRKEFDPAEIAMIYEAKKVDAISVITEENFFMGKLGFLPLVRNHTTRPLLRKDFIVDSYQIYEARAHYADAILLIASLLQKNQAAEFMHLAMHLGMSVLFEVHDHNELETALQIHAPIIGINNRNLRTMQIDMGTTFKMLNDIPDDTIVVSESGIKCFDDVGKLMDSRVDAMLVGSVLMESPDIGGKIDELRGFVSTDSVLK